MDMGGAGAVVNLVQEWISGRSGGRAVTSTYAGEVSAD
jgi:hypothetical protein